MPSHAFWKYCNDWKSLSVQPPCTPICRISKAQSALTGLGYTKEYGWLMSWLYLNNHILPAWCNHSLYRQKTARAAMEKELAQTSYWWQGQPLPWLQTSTRPNRDFARSLSLSHSLSLSLRRTHTWTDAHIHTPPTAWLIKHRPLFTLKSVRPETAAKLWQEKTYRTHWKKERKKRKEVYFYTGFLGQFVQCFIVTVTVTDFMAELEWLGLTCIADLEWVLFSNEPWIKAH